MCSKFNILLVQLFSKLSYDNYGICKEKSSLYLLWVEIMAVEDWKGENTRSSECVTWNNDFYSEQLRSCDNLSFFFKWGQRTLKYSGTQRLIQKCWRHELKYSLWLGFQSLEMEECVENKVDGKIKQCLSWRLAKETYKSIYFSGDSHFCWWVVGIKGVGGKIEYLGL